MIEIGQYDESWPDWHLGPEQAVEPHRRVRGAVMLPVHWGLFALASHGWTEPIERVLAAARDAGAVVISPSAGAERRAHRGEAPGALVARTAMAHRDGESDRRAPRRLSRSRRRKIRFAAIQRIDKC
jgi:hypothetical protein